LKTQTRTILKHSGLRPLLHSYNFLKTKEWELCGARANCSGDGHISDRYIHYLGGSDGKDDGENLGVNLAQLWYLVVQSIISLHIAIKVFYRCH
jgi:hypothetical protein